MWRLRLMALMVCACLSWGPGAVSAHDEDEGWGDASDVEAPPDFDGLTSYGDWVLEPTHGRVWHPRVDADWRPYWRGHWSRRGEWVWVSADPWGNAPYHYGEWAWSVRFGWVWIPGTVWSPARVTWIVDGPIIAWAPASVQITIGPDPRLWVYADADHFNRRIVRPYRLPPPYWHVSGGEVIRDLDRVIAPHRPARRTFRPESPRERSVTLGTERQVVTGRDDHANPRVTAESSRGPGRGLGTSRGFERRDTR
jgi:hypothetical protein